MTEKMNEFRSSPGSMRLRRGNLRQLFHKRLPLACFVAASPAPHAKLHRDAPADPGDDARASRDAKLTACRRQDRSLTPPGALK
jgi:hypothetical protein